jgi:hypothetical protein
MASSQSPNRVYFTSFDRSVNDTNTDFSITFDTPVQNAYNFEVVSASFPNLFKPFAPYETILYIYHEDFLSGSIAIAIPLSTTLTGGTGESPAPADRDTYIDKRYFADGTALATFLTDWLQSLATSWPTQASGLQPYYYPNDNPTAAPVYVASAVLSNMTWTDLSFTYDDLTSDGSLKMTFADSAGKAVRVASILDFGSLSIGYKLPSLLGFKMGYTSFEYESFDASGIVEVRENNNQFLFASLGAEVIQLPIGDYAIANFPTLIADAMNAKKPRGYSGVVSATETGGVLTITLGANPESNPAYLGFANYQGAKTLFGYVSDLITFAAGGASVAATNAVPTSTSTPAVLNHVAPDPINIIRTAQVYVASSLSSGESLASGGRKDILFAIPLTAGIGQIQLYQSSLSGIVVNRPPNSIRNLRVSLLDDNYQIMEPLPQNAPVNVEIHFAYKDDKKASEIDRMTTNLYA